jgi:hypothetical protein
VSSLAEESVSRETMGSPLYYILLGVLARSLGRQGVKSKICPSFSYLQGKVNCLGLLVHYRIFTTGNNIQTLMHRLLGLL